MIFWLSFSSVFHAIWFIAHALLGAIGEAIDVLVRRTSDVFCYDIDTAAGLLLN